MFYRLVFRLPVDSGEKISTIVIMIGAICMTLDPTAQKAGDGESNVALGDFYALLSGVFGTFAVLATK